MNRILLLLLSSFFPFVVMAAEKPNIIYIMADDLGVGDVGCYGQALLRTPRIDELAKEGMRFTQHYSGSSSCAPTRSCLMTGQHTGHTRVRSNGDGPLLDQDVTVGEVLKSAGYRTAAIGKWGVGEEGTTGVPWYQGFDHFFGYLNQRNAHSHYPPFIWRNEEKVLYPGNEEFRTHYSHDEFTREALTFIEENQDQPFFLYVPFTLVHVDLDVPQDSVDPWVGKVEETEPYGTPGGQHYIHQKTPHAAFAGMVSRLDRDVGRIVDLVDELGLSDNTLIVFTSDNGPTYAGGADPGFFDGNADFRGLKFDFYEGGIRCPMIARWPGMIEAGSESSHVSAHWDVMPTLAELTGVDPPGDIDGISFLPTLYGNVEKQKTHEFLYWESASKGGWQAIRQGNWKIHRQKTRQGKAAMQTELYNLSTDSAETKDVAEEFPDVLARLAPLFESGRTPQANGDPLFSSAKKEKKKSK